MRNMFAIGIAAVVAATAPAADLISLEGSLQPLVEGFNADKGKLRFVTILSPT